MGFLPTGALLKNSAEQPEMVVEREKPLVIPVIVHRDASLTQSLTLTLVSDGLESSPFSAESREYSRADVRCDFEVEVNAERLTNTEYPLTIRATLMKDEQYHVVSETTECRAIVPIAVSVKRLSQSLRR